ncbi:OLC1v1024664C2 [Oldenlandia corymbosa var. corymbosa]|uniref:OLC1v1024664C2 n=1 Tax=Oldenlandia corymbosa var. corymbosa TaxID=529605 RepID=A0AAV1C5R2_OLDCO|nr:OLC1v1024664C2 [Oldenlandia corymbosa var. corymbosa]
MPSTNKNAFISLLLLIAFCLSFSAVYSNENKTTQDTYSDGSSSSLSPPGVCANCSVCQYPCRVQPPPPPPGTQPIYAAPPPPVGPPGQQANCPPAGPVICCGGQQYSPPAPPYNYYPYGGGNPIPSAEPVVKPISSMWLAAAYFMSIMGNPTREIEHLRKPPPAQPSFSRYPQPTSGGGADRRQSITFFNLCDFHDIGACMASYLGKSAPSNGSVYVCNLPPGTTEDMVAEHFGKLGVLKKDKRTGRPKIWFYRDKITNEPKGDATVTYEDPHAASAAVEWYNNKDFHGATIGVFIAESKNKEDQSYNSGSNVVDQNVGSDLIGLEVGSTEINGGAGRGRGRGDASGKAWQQDGDWMCPNTSCSNVNFAFRGVCNRCGSARPSGVSGGAAGSGGRGRGAGGQESGNGSRAAVGGLFGPNDWPCPMCGNINWAKRTKCNICNTNKPGHNEGGVRGGRGGGYKELDEEELEETKRRRREAEEDDGEMYDEFGNLKKKFRAKMQQTEAGQKIPGVGRAGWDVDELGASDRDRKERSRDKSRDSYEREKDRHRSRSRSRERDRGRDSDRDYSYDRDREHKRERDRDRERSRYRY